jgi:hypothetical protein
LFFVWFEGARKVLGWGQIPRKDANQNTAPSSLQKASNTHHLVAVEVLLHDELLGHKVGDLLAVGVG